MLLVHLAPVSSLLVVGAFSTAFRCVCIISLCHLDYLWTYCLLLDANLSATNPPAIPHWWKRQPLIPTLLSQELKNFLKLNVKEKKYSDCRPVIIDESAGEVVIGANTRICHGAVIQGPVVIGANCLIGNYAFIRHAQ